jgi:hypothetical protein
MKLDRSHKPWAFIVGALTLIFAALYAGSISESGRIPLIRLPLPSWLLDSASSRNTVGAKPLGLIFGILAFAIFLFASALGVRKKRRLWRIGNVQLWLKAHVWLTILTIPLVLFHCGFRLGGLHTSILFWLYAIVMVSGFWGLAMQHFLPHLMMERLPREFVYEQIPNVRATMFEAALAYRRQLDDLLNTQSKAAVPVPAANVAETRAQSATLTGMDPSVRVMAEFLRDDALPFLSDNSASRTRLADRRGAEDVFKLLRINVSEIYRPQVDEIRQWCDDHRLMAKQTKLHHWLHGWLIFHVPVSIILLLWTTWHIYITFTYLN